MEFLSPEEIGKRFPALPYIQSKFPTVVDNDAAIIFAEEYIKSSAEFVRKQANMELLEVHELLEVINDAKGATLTIRKGDQTRRVKCKQAVLTCGRWISSLVPEMKGLVREIRQTASIWEMERPDDYRIGDYPLWLHTNSEGKTYYSMPDAHGMKFGLRNNDPDLYHKLGG